jgi:multisubunit Na+/H+ antiporter MnhC subunit
MGLSIGLNPPDIKTYFPATYLIDYFSIRQPRGQRFSNTSLGFTPPPTFSPGLLTSAGMHPPAKSTTNPPHTASTSFTPPSIVKIADTVTNETEKFTKSWNRSSSTKIDQESTSPVSQITSFTVALILASLLVGVSLTVFVVICLRQQKKSGKE